MFYVEFLDDHENWESNIGDCNEFETKEEAIEMIGEFMKYLPPEGLCENDLIMKWRILDDEDNVVEFLDREIDYEQMEKEYGSFRLSNEEDYLTHED